MRRVAIGVLLLAGAAVMTAALPLFAHAGPATELLPIAGLGNVSIYAPEKAPTQVVLFLSGDGGWNLGVIDMAERLRDLGALVAGVDIRSFIHTLEESGECAYPAGTLEELSRAVQLHRKLSEYKTPLLVGYSSGATFVYAALAQAPAETFAGAISLGFCPETEMSKPLCAMRVLKTGPKKKGPGENLLPGGDLAKPWIVLQGELDQVCASAATRVFVKGVPSARLVVLPKVGHGFGVPRNWNGAYVDAYRRIAASEAANETPVGTEDRAGTLDPEVRALGLTEVAPSEPGAAFASPSDAFAIVMSGDGGWAELDKHVAAGLAARGIPCVGWSSLKYYWSPRTPDEAAKELATIVEHYAATWKKPRVLLVGYSFGADVLPFLVNRLPAEVQGRIESVSLLGLGDAAAFEFHISGWLGGRGDPSYPTAPEVMRVPVPVRLIFGAGEKAGVRRLAGSRIAQFEVGEGHHFSGEFDRLVDIILGKS